MGINLGQIGAFAGGLGKGYLAADDMEQTRKRTAVLEREAALREEANTRANEQQGWQREKQERDAAMRSGMEEIVKNAPWKKREDGTWDPRDPENQPVWDSVLLQQIQLQMKNGDIPLDKLKAIEDLKDRTKSATAQKAGQKYMSTGNLMALNEIPDSGFDFTGAQEVPIKEGWGSYTGIKLSNGQVIPKYVIVGLFDKNAGAAMQADVDNRRQGALTSAQISNLAADNARADKAAKQRDDEVKSETLLRIADSVEKKVLKPVTKNPVTGEAADPDPLYNSTASAMIAKRLKTFDHTKKGALERVDAVNDIASEVKSSLAKIDSVIEADAAAAKAAGKTVTSQKKAENRRKAYEEFVANGYALTDAQQAVLSPKPKEKKAAEPAPRQTQRYTPPPKKEEPDNEGMVYRRGGGFRPQ